ncbi:hypothetical protein GF374_03365 [Candidatus Woesearchaeota archaeon]|nr:hypothetical protein [Candidatus Woesearchaeota archaeon]
MFENVVVELKETHSTVQKYSVTQIKTDTPGSMAAVDGGAAILWSNGIQSIGVVTAGYIIYNENHNITHHKIWSQEVLLHTEEIDIFRIKAELRAVTEAAEFCDCVLFDGALQDIPETKFKDIITGLENVTVMGVTKKTTLDTLHPGVPDTTSLDNPGIWYYRISPPAIKTPFRPLGDVFIARFHEHGPSFRVDIRGDHLFGRLAYFSKYLFCLGYPYPLMEIHRATTLRDKKEYYQAELQKTMVANGLETEYFSGVYHLEKEREEFHQVLDGLI